MPSIRSDVSLVEAPNFLVRRSETRFTCEPESKIAEFPLAAIILTLAVANYFYFILVTNL
uniref:Uncharacterized protein n=1 Tax=Glossina pallidipes TaxID=7398 RepID=A0A1A9ZRN4_GLOPL